MMFMLDTNICIYAIKHKPEQVIRKILSLKPGELCISSITYAEMMHGVENSSNVIRNRIALALFLSSIQVLDFSTHAAEEYGKIKADLQRKGTPIGIMDTLIAAHARVNDLILVTNNVGEFQRVEKLKIENWVE